MAGAGATRETPAGGLSSRAPPTVAEEEQEAALALGELHAEEGEGFRRGVLDKVLSEQSVGAMREFQAPEE